MERITELTMYHQFKGDSEMKYINTTVTLPEELAERVTAIVEEAIPLRDMDIYEELTSLFEAAEDRSELHDSPLPDREVFADNEKGEEAYQEALRKYNEEAEGWYDCGYDIQDPGDEVRFVKRFRGENFPDHAGVVEGFDLINEEQTLRCVAQVEFTESGAIEAVEITECEGLEWEGAETSNWAECYPDFDLVEDALRAELEGGEADW